MPTVFVKFVNILVGFLQGVSDPNLMLTDVYRIEAWPVHSGVLD